MIPREGLPWQPSGEGSVLRSDTKIPYTVWHGRKINYAKRKKPGTQPHIRYNSIYMKYTD